MSWLERLYGVIVRGCKDVVGFTEFNSSEVVRCTGAIKGVSGET